MTSVALYSLTSQYRALAESLSELDLDTQTVADTIEASGITDEIAVKAQGLEMVARSMEMHGPAIDVEITRLQKLKKQREAYAQSLREYLLSNMLAMGITKIDTPLFKIAIRENPPSVLVSDEREIPPRFFKIPPPPLPVLDKKAVAEAIRAGEDVPGARLVRGKRLEIR